MGIHSTSRGYKTSPYLLHKRRIVNSEGHEWSPLGNNIQAAINDLPAEGGAVQLPARALYPTAKITDNGINRLKIEGWGDASRIIAPNGLNDDLLEITSIDELILRDFVLNHDKDNQAAGSALLLSSVTEFLLERVKGINAYNMNFDLRSTSHGEIVACIGENARDDNLSFMYACHDVIVRGGDYRLAIGLGVASAGIEIEDSSYDISLLGPVCRENTSGIIVNTSPGEDSTHDIVMDAPICHNNNEYGIKLATAEGALDNTRRISIKNPDCRLNTLSGIYALAGLGALVEDVEIVGGFSQGNGTWGAQCGNRVKNFHVKGTNLSGNISGPFNKAATCINCFVGDPHIFHWAEFMKIGSHTTRALDVAGRVYLTPIQIKEAMVMDDIYYFPTAGGGNIHVGLYEMGANFTPKTPAGGVLIVDSGSVAYGASFAPNRASVTRTWLPPGLYWIAVEADGVNVIINGHSETNLATSVLANYYYDRAGGYGALTDPCPAVTQDSDAPDWLWLGSPR